MKDQDQQLLWEAYVAEKKSVASRTPPKDKLNKGDFLPKKVRDEINDEEEEETVEETNHEKIETALKDGESICPKTGDIMKDGKVVRKKGADEDVKEEMNTLEFAKEAGHGASLHDMVFDAVLTWIEQDAAGMDSPEMMDGYNVESAFNSAKDAVKGELADISLSAVKEKMNLDARVQSPEQGRHRSEFLDRKPGSV